MGLLLDTHAFLWWIFDDPKLSGPARAAIADATDEVFVSAVSAFEIVTKHRIGKLDIAAPLASDVEAAIAGQDFTGLPLTLRQSQVAGGLPGPHRDPFDRMLMAQAMLEQLTIVSNERPFDAYGVRRLW